MARRPSILKKTPARRSPSRRLQFSKIITVGTIPNYPLPSRGFLRRNYPTRPLTRNMFPVGAYGNSLFLSMHGQRRAQHVSAQGRPRPTSANRQRALNAALARATALANELRQPNSPPLRRQNSRNRNSNSNNLYR